jgi:excisionase family DNA binding protein
VRRNLHQREEGGIPAVTRKRTIMPSRTQSPLAGQALLTVPQAAEYLNVSPRTVHNYIKCRSVPYIELPGGSVGGRRQYRIPLQGLLESLSGTYDVQAELRAQTDRARAQLAAEQSAD